MPLTPEQQAKQRKLLATYSRADLEAETLASLRELAAGVVRGRYRKAELIEQILLATAAERALLAVQAEPAAEQVDCAKAKARELAENVSDELGAFVKAFYRDFRAIVLGAWDGQDWAPEIWGDLAALGYRAIAWLNREQHAFTTQLRNRSRIVAALEELVQAERGALYYPQLESALARLKRNLQIGLADLTNQKRGLQESRIAERRENKELIDFAPLHRFATEALSNLGELKPAAWRQVSIALAIATGRRLAEIHRAATKFEYVDSRSVAFTGQLKAKGLAAEYFDSHPKYAIPVLVDAALVVAGHAWLKQHGKVADTPEQANKRYSKDLSEAVRGLKRSLGIRSKFFSFKGLRAIYAAVAVEVFNEGDFDELYLARILGHGRGALAAGEARIKDTITPQSYKSDFKVTGWQCAARA